MLLGLGGGTFEPAPAGSGVGVSDTPFLADLTGNGISDSVVLDRSGNILYRAGLPGEPGTFAPPVILNPGRPARAITLVRIGSQYAIAAADAHDEPTASAGQFVFTVSIYTVGPGGAVSRLTAFSTSALPTSLAAADLTGDGLDDLIAANALNDSVTIALQTAPGTFAAPITVPVGIAPSDIAVADLTGAGPPDIIVTDQASGEVTVLLNDPSHRFGQSLTFAAGAGPYGVDTASGSPTESAFAGSVSLVAGDFIAGGGDDLAVLDQETHSFTVLAADGDGGLAAPRTGLTTSTSDGLAINNRPVAMVAGEFTIGGPMDLAVLMEDTGQVWIYTGNGDGTFRHTSSIPVGDEATGLSVVPGDGPGLLDLLVGNGYGDVLILDGKGDGTFQIQGSRVSLSVVPDLLGPGEAGVLVGDQANNRVTVQAPSAGGNRYSPVRTLGTAASSIATGAGRRPVGVPRSRVDLARRHRRGHGQQLRGGLSHPVHPGRRAHLRPLAADLLRRHRPGQRHGGRHQRRRHPRHADRQPGEQRRLGAVRLVRCARRLGGHPRPAPEVRRRRPHRDDPGRPDRRRLARPRGLQRRQRHRDAAAGGRRRVLQRPGPEDALQHGRRGGPAAHLRRRQRRGLRGDGRGGPGAVQPATIPPPAPSWPSPAGRCWPRRPSRAGRWWWRWPTATSACWTRSATASTVASVLEAEGGIAALPSTIDVVSKANGQFDVLVSSQGSDTIFVYAQGAAFGGSSSPILTVSSSPASSPFQAPAAFTPSQSFLLTSSTITTNASQASASAATASSSSSSSSASVTASTATTVGLSLGGFSSLGNGSHEGDGGTILVPVEGNTYLSVPILDSGPRSDGEDVDGHAHALARPPA